MDAILHPSLRAADTWRLMDLSDVADKHRLCPSCRCVEERLESGVEREGDATQKIGLLRKCLWWKMLGGDGGYNQRSFFPEWSLKAAVIKVMQ